ncbi:hypothetical protein DPMN_098025 [Dreissena polymorpha]|uniref:Uncharacterized protein n=1 Tax=Dreissena polymorpha TaxID=45954 RepID=A0A9D4LBJ3_DREPO|nr:hypothetical protein DPMN_098025 [Dreissena polymorpha]
MLLYTFQVQKRKHPETAVKLMRAASATPANPDPGSGISGSEDSSASSSGTAMPPTNWDEEGSTDEEPTASLPFLTREYCLSLPPHAKVMKGRQSCK